MNVNRLIEYVVEKTRVSSEEAESLRKFESFYGKDGEVHAALVEIVYNTTNSLDKSQATPFANEINNLYDMITDLIEQGAKRRVGIANKETMAQVTPPTNISSGLLIIKDRRDGVMVSESICQYDNTTHEIFSGTIHPTTLNPGMIYTVYIIDTAKNGGYRLGRQVSVYENRLYAYPMGVHRALYQITWVDDTIDEYPALFSEISGLVTEVGIPESVPNGGKPISQIKVLVSDLGRVYDAVFDNGEIRVLR